MKVPVSILIPIKNEAHNLPRCLEALAWAAENGKQNTESGNNLDGYWINRRFMFVGKWLKHAYYPNWNLRLFRHKLGRYEKLTDVATASGDNAVHEHMVIESGRTGRLKREMDHYAVSSVDVFIEKHNRYANWEARVAMNTFLKSSSGGLQMSSVGMRRKLKLLSQKLPFRPALRFLSVFPWPARSRAIILHGCMCSMNIFAW